MSNHITQIGITGLRASNRIVSTATPHTQRARSGDVPRATAGALRPPAPSHGTVLPWTPRAARGI